VNWVLTRRYFSDKDMPFVLLLVGAVLLLAGIRNTYGALWSLIKGDFTGTNSFLPWVAAIAVVGGLGYVPRLRPLAIAFMTLLLLVLIISNSGVFAKLQQFVTSGGAGGGVSPLPTLTPIQPATINNGANIQSPLDQINSNLSGGLPN
jgi:hypothetical protein